MSVFLGAVSVLVIQWLWPLYYTYSLYFLNGNATWYAITRHLTVIPTPQIMAGAGICASSMITLFLFGQGPIAYVLEQYRFMLNCFGLLFLALLISFVTAVVKKRKIHVEEGDTLSLALIQIILQGLALLYLGQANGAYLSYFLQLWMPYVIIAALICVCRYFNFSKKLLNLGMIATFSFLSIYLGYHKLPLFMMSEDDIANWQQARNYIETYEINDSNEQSVYYSPELAYLAMEQGKRAYDNGHTGVIRTTSMDSWKDDVYAKRAFPKAGEVIEKNVTYQEKILNDINNKCINLVTVDELQIYIDAELLTQSGYKRIDTLPLACGNANYDVEFWIPEDPE